MYYNEKGILDALSLTLIRIPTWSSDNIFRSSLTRCQGVFELRALSSGDVPVVLLNHPIGSIRADLEPGILDTHKRLDLWATSVYFVMSNF